MSSSSSSSRHPPWHHWGSSNFCVFGREFDQLVFNVLLDLSLCDFTDTDLVGGAKYGVLLRFCALLLDGICVETLRCVDRERQVLTCTDVLLKVNPGFRERQLEVIGHGIPPNACTQIPKVFLLLGGELLEGVDRPLAKQLRKARPLVAATLATIFLAICFPKAFAANHRFLNMYGVGRALKPSGRHRQRTHSKSHPK